MTAVLPWVRLATDMPENPKILELLTMPRGSHTAFVYLCSLSFCGNKGTYGSIPKAALPFVHATLKDAKTLVKVGLWEATKTGWEVHDWDVYQPTKEYIEGRKNKARTAARARWDKAPEHAEIGTNKDAEPPF